MISFEGTKDSILVHQPHGGGNVVLERTDLLKYGKRLSKRRGWGYGMSVERKKEKA